MPTPGPGCARLLWTLFASLAVLACAAAEGPPDAALNEGLHLSLEQQRSLPLRVVSGAPEGTVDGTEVQVQVVFSKPIRALTLASEEPAVPVRVTPEIAGSFQWVGTNAVVLHPDPEGVQSATEYTVSVPAGVAALDGSQLAEEFKFSFETPRPSVIDISESGADYGTTPESRFLVTTDQPVTAAALFAVTHLRVGPRGDAPPETNLAFDVQPVPDDPERLLVVPKEPLPLDSQVEVTIDAGLECEAGPLPSLERRQERYQTYGPLRAELGCDAGTDACVGRPWLVFDNPVARSELRGHVRVEPSAGAVLEVDPGGDATSTSYALGGRYQRNVHYRVVLDPNIRDVFGQRLGQRRELTFQMGDPRPLIDLGAYGGFLEPSLASGVTIASVNVSEYEVLSRRLEPRDVAQMLRSGDDLFELFPDIERRTVRPRAAFNRQDTHVVSFREVLGQSLGAMLVGYSYYDAEQDQVDSRVEVVQPTDLALDTRLSAEGGLAWVTNLSDGRPVADASVRLVDLTGASGHGFHTDSDGVAHIPASELASAGNDVGGIVVAERGQDWVYSRVPGRAADEPRELGYVFTDRGIYRPSEPVHVKGWLRRETRTGTEPLPGRQLTIALRDGATEHQSVETMTNAFGGFDATLEIPSYARLVDHEITVTTGGPMLQTSFRVEEYRAAEFEAELNSSDEPVVRGQEVSATVHGDYLFGGPMVGAGVDWTAFTSQSHFAPAGSDGFTTDAWAYESELAQALGLTVGKRVARTSVLDDRGQARAAFSTRFDAFGPVSYVVTAVVSDASRQQIATSDRTLVHPGQFYLGLALPEGSASVGASLRPRVRAFALSGEPVAERRVTAELYRLVRTGDSNPKLERVGDCALLTTAAEASCSLVPRKAGTHVVLVRGRDDAGNELFAATGTRVGSFDWGGRYEAWESDEPTIELDQDMYRAGDTAHVRVLTHEPDSEVLLNLERERIFWHERKRARDHVAAFDVPVTSDITRNADLTAVVVRGQLQRGHAEWKQEYRPDELSPKMWTARALLEIDQSQKRLHVAITPQSFVTTPGSKVPVRILVTDSAGAGTAAEVALAAVDEGVLMLTNYEMPDPLSLFTPLRSSLIDTADSREMLGWLFRPALEERASQGFGAGYGRLGGSHRVRAPRIRMGATKVGDEPPEARQDFTTTPYWNPSILTDETGHAEVSVALSQLVTRFRLMAVATGKQDRFGLGESSIESRLPLMVRPAMPRFARVGDSFLAGVLISSTEVDSDAVSVTVTARGVRIDGPKQKRVSIAKHGTREVRFSFHADEPGTAELEFRVRAAARDDAVRVSIPISVALTPEAVAVYGKTAVASGERIASLAGAAPGFGELDVSLSSTALVGLGDAIDGLSNYPYGCTEQLTSRLLPLLPLRDLARDFGVAGTKTRDEDIQSLLTEILGRQRADGGFGLWPDDPQSHPWVSAYVARLLDEASKRGIAVPEQAVDRVFSYLIDLANTNDDEGYDSRPALAYVAYVLAENGTPSRVLTEHLLKDEDELPTFARALLLHTLALVLRDPAKTEPAAERAASWVKQVEAHAQKLERSLLSKVRISGNVAFVSADEGDHYGFLFDSQTRTHALVLSALLARNPDHPLAERLARGLLAARRGGSFRSTQESAFALLALDSYRKKQEAAVPNFDAAVWLGDHTLGRSQHHGRSLATSGFVVPMSDLPTSGDALVFQKEGRGTLFYQALLRYSPKELPTKSLDHGFFIDSKLYPVPRGSLPGAVQEGLAPGSERFSAGDVVLGDVTVIAPVDRNFVAIEVPLPAGFEAIDVSLATQREQPFVDLTSSVYASDWSRRELRDDRVLYFLNHMHPGTHRFTYLARATSSGTFVLPPVTVSEMYAPENFGRTRAHTISVAAPVRSK